MTQKSRPQSEALSGTPQPGFVGYGLPAVVAKRPPTGADTGYPIGQLWTNKLTGDSYILGQISAGVAYWGVASSGTGAVATLTGDVGGAVSPIAGNINVLGTSVAAGTTPVDTSGAVDTLTINVQTSQAIAASDASRIGLAAFDSSSFTVDANGFVSLSGGGLAIDSIHPDSGTDPVVPNGSGLVNIVGSGSTTTVGSLNTLTVELTGLTNHALQVGAGTTTLTQLSPSATSGIPLISQGVAADPAYGTAVVAGGGTGAVTLLDHGVLVGSGTSPIDALAVGANGQVLIGSTGADPVFASLTSADSSITFTPGAGTLDLTVSGGTTVGKTITGDSGGALAPTAGNWNILGTSTVPGTSPVNTSGAGSTLTVNVQKTQAIAATDATKVGLAAFDSTSFAVDANGFVSLAGGGLAIDSIHPNSGTDPVVPNGSGLVNIVGSGSTTTVGSLNTLTMQLTGLSNHAIQVGAGTDTLTQVGPSATTGQILQSQGLLADPAFSTATYPSTTNINRLLFSSSDNVVGQISTISNGALATNLTGTPAYVSLNSNGALLIGSTGAGGPVGATLTEGTGIDILNAAGSITISVDGAVVGQTITGDSGGALSPTAGNWNLLGSGSIATSGSGSTLTTALTGLTNHAVLVGAGTSTITKLAVGATGTLLVGATGADPAFGTSANGDFTFTTSTAGAVRTLTVSNTNNSNSSSRAVVQTTTGGASSGDPYHIFTITGVTDWALGVDNSQSDIFALSNNDTLGPGYVMTWATGGAVSCTSGNFDATRSASGADVSLTASNTSNTASSTATLYATVAGTSANDPRTQYAVSGTTTFTQGIDNSDSDAFVVAASTALGTTNTLRIATTGEMTMPLQSAFLAYKSGNTSNVTGAGTVYTIIQDTEIYDQNADFNNATGTFTAPLTARYQFTLQAGLFGLSAAMTELNFDLVTSNRTYRLCESACFALADPTASLEVHGATFADMDAADTALVQITVLNGAGDTADLDGGSVPTRTSFGGKIVC